MKKTFLKVSAVFALVLLMSISFVGCKDYDDDISTLKEQNGILSTQYSTLESALAAAKDETANAQKSANEAIEAAKAAQAAGDAATAAAQAAAAQAELAKQAAAQAEADAISQVMGQVQALMATTASKDDLNQLAGKISGIQESLNKLATVAQVDQLARDLEAANVQIEALNAFKELVNTQLAQIPGLTAEISTINNNVTDLTNQLEGVRSDITSLQNSISTNTSEINTINQKLQTLSNTINTQISTEVNTLAGVLVSRLTSLSFIPDSYVGGIPTIDFASASYTEMVLKDNTHSKYVKGSGPVILTSDGASAEFFTHPYAVKSESIDFANIAIIGKEASSRSSQDISQLIALNGTPTIADGKLTMQLKKITTESLNNKATDKVNIVAFRIPVKKDAEYGETENPMVYSEFIRLSEQSPFTPEIAEASDITKNFQDYDLAFSTTPTSSVESMKVKYSETADLSKLVTGRRMVNGKPEEMTVSDLKNYNLVLKFEVPNKSGDIYLGQDGVTNQQVFGQVTEDGIFSVPSKNANAVGRMPIVLVKLIDTANGNKVIDARYFKVLITKTDMADIVITTPIDLGEALLPTTNAETREFKLDWTKMNDLIYAKIGTNGISKTDFGKIYTNVTYQTPNTKTADINLNFITGPTSTDALVWRLSPDYIGSIIEATAKPGDRVSKKFQIDITCNDPKGLNPDVKFSVTATIYAILPTPGMISQISWANNKYKLEPVIYVPGTMDKCKYDNDIWGGFMNRTMYKAGQPVGTWDLQFDKTQPSGYKSDAGSTLPSTVLGATSANGYKLNKGAEAGAELTYNSNHSAWANLMDPATDTYGTHFSVMKNDAGKGLISKDVYVGEWARLNAYNVCKVASYIMNIVAPLTINPVPSNLSFTDGVIGGSKISINSLLTMKDFHGETVANTSGQPKALYDYYEVGTPVWDTSSVKAGVTASGDIDDNLNESTGIDLNRAYPNASISISGSDLVFNNPNVKVVKPFNVFINVKLTYGFGQFDQWMKVRVNPAPSAIGAKAYRR